MRPAGSNQSKGHDLARAAVLAHADLVLPQIPDGLAMAVAHDEIQDDNLAGGGESRRPLGLCRQWVA
jgi:hypothetical protein